MTLDQSYQIIQSTNYVDFITANSKVVYMAGFVTVLAIPQGLKFIIIKVNISRKQANN